MSFSENKEFWTSFIELYKSLPCLWKVKDKKLYLNKELKAQAYEILVGKCNEINSDADTKYVKTKIESLKNGFRRELRLLRKSKRTGTDSESVYEPTLWYFDLMLFLLDQEELRSGISSIDQGQNEEDTEYVVGSPLSPELPKTPDSVLSTASSSISRTSTNKTLSFNAKKAKFIDIATSALTSTPPRTGFEGFGETVAKDLNSMDSMQSTIAQKIISDILYYGKLKRLNESCSFVPASMISQQDTCQSMFQFPGTSFQAAPQIKISCPKSAYQSSFSPASAINQQVSQSILKNTGTSFQAAPHTQIVLQDTPRSVRQHPTAASKILLQPRIVSATATKAAPQTQIVLQDTPRSVRQHPTASKILLQPRTVRTTATNVEDENVDDDSLLKYIQSK